MISHVRGKSCSLFKNNMFRVFTFDELPSTNDYLKHHASEYLHSDVIWAKKQTNGRGRFTRQWISGEDLTCSILFRKSEYAHTLLAPLAVVFALSTLGIETQIKWPNDILYKGKKCCGILVESIFEGNTFGYDIVGIGINVNNEFATDLIDKAIALPISIDIESLLYQLIRSYAMVLRMDQESILRQYRKYSYLIGKKITYRDELWDVLDFKEHGELNIGKDGVVKTLLSEEISLASIYKDR